MAVSNDFLQYVLDQLSGWGKIHIKRMFGVVALYQEELAFGMIANDVVYLKIDSTNREKYIAAGCKPLKPYDKTVHSFYSVPLEVLEDAREFIEWANESLNIQKTRITKTILL